LVDASAIRERDRRDLLLVFVGHVARFGGADHLDPDLVPLQQRDHLPDAADALGRVLPEPADGDRSSVSRGLVSPTGEALGDRQYIFDEPEAALSPARQLGLLKLIHDLAERTRSQFIIATHSPILMAYPDALIYHLSATGIAPIKYEDTEHYQVTRSFLADPARYFKHLFADDEPASTSPANE